jgi:hypothetical protein
MARRRHAATPPSGVRRGRHPTPEAAKPCENCKALARQRTRRPCAGLPKARKPREIARRASIHAGTGSSPGSKTSRAGLETKVPPSKRRRESRSVVSAGASCSMRMIQPTCAVLALGPRPLRTGAGPTEGSHAARPRTPILPVRMQTPAREQARSHARAAGRSTEDAGNVSRGEGCTPPGTVAGGGADARGGPQSRPTGGAGPPVAERRDPCWSAQRRMMGGGAGGWSSGTMQAEMSKSM